MTNSPINNTVVDTTLREKGALHFLSDKMEATAKMVGDAITNNTGLYGQRVGAIVLGQLRKKGLVMRLSELNAWRLTREGREYVKTR